MPDSAIVLLLSDSEGEARPPPLVRRFIGFVAFPPRFRDLKGTRKAGRLESGLACAASRYLACSSKRVKSQNDILLAELHIARMGPPLPPPNFWNAMLESLPGIPWPGKKPNRINITSVSGMANWRSLVYISVLERVGEQKAERVSLSRSRTVGAERGDGGG